MRSLQIAGTLLLTLTAMTHTAHTLIPVFKEVYEIRSENSQSGTSLVSPAFRLEKIGDVYRVVIDEKPLEPRRVLEGFRIITESQ